MQLSKQAHCVRILNLGLGLGLGLFDDPLAELLELVVLATTPLHQGRDQPAFIYESMRMLYRVHEPMHMLCPMNASTRCRLH